MIKISKASLFGSLLIAALTIGWSCKKTPQPSPTPNPTTPADTITPVSPNDTIVPTPDDTITPILDDTLPPIPGRVAVFYIRHVDAYDSISNTWGGYMQIPTLDTIRYLANHPGCDTIFLKWYYPPAMCYGWTWHGFVVSRDSLEKRFQISPKVRGSKRPLGIFTKQILPDDITNVFVLGMRHCDSLWFANHDYRVEVRP